MSRATEGFSASTAIVTAATYRGGLTLSGGRAGLAEPRDDEQLPLVVDFVDQRPAVRFDPIGPVIEHHAAREPRIVHQLEDELVDWRRCGNGIARNSASASLRMTTLNLAILAELGEELFV